VIIEPADEDADEDTATKTGIPRTDDVKVV
jgi:hypothetical protein